MNPEELQSLVREQGPCVFDRMFAAVEKVRERLERACQALESGGIPYAVIGGNAVAAWVATIDDGAVRNTRDVDLLLREDDLDRATTTPLVEQARLMDGKRIVELPELVRMKLNSYRDKDRTHLRDMIQIGLIDATWPKRFEPELGRRLQTLIDDPEG